MGRPGLQVTQETREAYYRRLRDRRLAEAQVLWAEMQDAGVASETVLALDFSHFCTGRAGAEALAAQLAENYSVEEAQHRDWVAFMSDVAESHSGVFASWLLEAPRMDRRFSSEEIDLE